MKEKKRDEKNYWPTKYITRSAQIKVYNLNLVQRKEAKLAKQN
jgi:hypothetical protein